MSQSVFVMWPQRRSRRCPIRERMFLWRCHSEEKCEGTPRREYLQMVSTSSVRSGTIEMTYAKTPICTGRLSLWHRHLGIHHYGAAAGSRSQFPGQYPQDWDSRLRLCAERDPGLAPGGACLVADGSQTGAADSDGDVPRRQCPLRFGADLP